jgi:hypothetical protein
MNKEIERLREEVAGLNCEKEQMKTALEQCEDRFNKLFHASSNPIAITSIKDGRILDLNEASASRRF